MGERWEVGAENGLRGGMVMGGIEICAFTDLSPSKLPSARQLPHGPIAHSTLGNGWK